MPVVATGMEKVSLHFNFKERQCQRMFKLLYNYAHFTCKQGNAQNPSVSASAVYELRISRGTRGQIANICWIIEKAREFQKNSAFASLTTLKPLTVWITTNCGKFLKT